MLKELSIDQSKEVFKINSSNRHLDTKGLFLCYCYATDRPYDIYADFSIGRQEADRLVGLLVENKVRIPTAWNNDDLSALFFLLEESDFIEEATEIYELLEYGY